MKTKKGDTLIEVAIALAVFGMVSVLTIMIMNSSFATIQKTLELVMARNEIDAQAEALRFIHNSYLSERELVESERVYQDLWLQLSRGTTAISATHGTSGTGLSNNPAAISAYPAVTCEEYYNMDHYNDIADPNDVHGIKADNAFILNTRKINPVKTSYSDTDGISNTIIRVTEKQDIFTMTPLYPRVIFTNPAADTFNSSSEEEMQEQNIGGEYDKVKKVQGIWVIATRDATKKSAYNLAENDPLDFTPEFYDFHIRTCWYGPGQSRPTTIATVIRLYNPEYTEDTR